MSLKSADTTSAVLRERNLYHKLEARDFDYISLMNIVYTGWGTIPLHRNLCNNFDFIFAFNWGKLCIYIKHHSSSAVIVHNVVLLIPLYLKLWQNIPYTWCNDKMCSPSENVSNAHLWSFKEGYMAAPTYQRIGDKNPTTKLYTVKIISATKNAFLLQLSCGLSPRPYLFAIISHVYLLPKAWYCHTKQLPASSIYHWSR